MDKEMTYKDLGKMLLTISIATLVLYGLIYMSRPIPETSQQRLTFDKCCDGDICSDVYYDNETGECRYTFDKSLYLPFNH